MRLELPVEGPYDPGRTLGGHRLGKSDPTMRLGDDSLLKAVSTPSGWALIEGRYERARAIVEVSISGPGGGAVADAGKMAAFFGLHDRDAASWAGSIAPTAMPAWMASRARERAGVRLVRALDLFESHVIAILQQRVTYADAVRSYRALHLRFAEEVGAGLRAPLDPRAWRAIPSYEARAAGVDRHRYEAIQHAARVAHRTRKIESPAALRALFQHVPGTGPWTTEMVAAFGLGDPDAVMTGDVNLPRQVAQLFRDSRSPSDARMLELLEPYRPHRFRTVRLAVSG